MSNTPVFSLMRCISRLVPKNFINKLIISPSSKHFAKIYDIMPKPEGPTIYQIQNKALIELDLSKPGERAISFDAFEPKITKRFLQTLRFGSVVIDVGAWIGYYTVLAAKQVGSAGRVIAIEPHKGNFNRIERNVYLNDFQNVTLLNVAVGDRQCRELLSEGTDSLTHRVGGNEAGTEISVDSLDNIIDKSGFNAVDLLIMDIEGYEFLALKGAKYALERGIITNIICEIHPDKLRQNRYSDLEVLESLTSLGYTVQKFTDMVNVYHIHARK